jgi:hypothetical protein
MNPYVSRRRAVDAKPRRCAGTAAAAARHILAADIVFLKVNRLRRISNDKTGE